MSIRSGPSSCIRISARFGYVRLILYPDQRNVEDDQNYRAQHPQMVHQFENQSSRNQRRVASSPGYHVNFHLVNITSWSRIRLKHVSSVMKGYNGRAGEFSSTTFASCPAKVIGVVKVGLDLDRPLTQRDRGERVNIRRQGRVCTTQHGDETHIHPICRSGFGNRRRFRPRS